MNTTIARKFLLFFGLFVVAIAQIWQNDYGAELNVDCGKTSALYRVMSEHSNDNEDRQWRWECLKVVDTPFDQCAESSDYLNEFDLPLYFKCDQDYVLTGVHSYYDSVYKDRRWKAKCCKSSDHFVQDCRISGYINEDGYDSYIDYFVDLPEVFTGFFSAHKDEHE